MLGKGDAEPFLRLRDIGFRSWISNPIFQLLMLTEFLNREGIWSKSMVLINFF